jgi:hypothetical protein
MAATVGATQAVQPVETGSQMTGRPVLIHPASDFLPSPSPASARMRRVGMGTGEAAPMSAGDHARSKAAQMVQAISSQQLLYGWPSTRTRPGRRERMSDAAATRAGTMSLEVAAADADGAVRPTPKAPTTGRPAPPPPTTVSSATPPATPAVGTRVTRERREAWRPASVASSSSQVTPGTDPLHPRPSAVAKNSKSSACSTRGGRSRWPRSRSRSRRWRRRSGRRRRAERGGAGGLHSGARWTSPRPSPCSRRRGWAQ